MSAHTKGIECPRYGVSVPYVGGITEHIQRLIMVEFDIIVSKIAENLEYLFLLFRTQLSLSEFVAIILSLAA